MKKIGDWGESKAAQYLEQKGYEILTQGYRTRYGEIDLIARDGAYIVFIEVKTRKHAGFAHALEAVDMRKIEKIRSTAALYLVEHEPKEQPRFDVLEVYAAQGRETLHPVIHHLEDAF